MPVWPRAAVRYGLLRAADWLACILITSLHSSPWPAQLQLLPICCHISDVSSICVSRLYTWKLLLCSVFLFRLVLLYCDTVFFAQISFQAFLWCCIYNYVFVKDLLYKCLFLPVLNFDLPWRPPTFPSLLCVCSYVNVHISSPCFLWQGEYIMVPVSILVLVCAALSLLCMYKGAMTPYPTRCFFPRCHPFLDIIDYTILYMRLFAAW